MQTVNLYLYNDENGVVTITPNPRAETDEPSRLRLIADEGMILTDGNTQTPAKDVMLDEKDNWHEISEVEAQAMMSADMGGEQYG